MHQVGWRGAAQPLLFRGIAVRSADTAMCDTAPSRNAKTQASYWTIGDTRLLRMRRNPRLQRLRMPTTGISLRCRRLLRRSQFMIDNGDQPVRPKDRAAAVQGQPLACAEDGAERSYVEAGRCPCFSRATLIRMRAPCLAGPRSLRHQIWERVRGSEVEMEELDAVSDEQSDESVMEGAVSKRIRGGAGWG